MSSAPSLVSPSQIALKPMQPSMLSVRSLRPGWLADGCTAAGVPVSRKAPPTYNLSATVSHHGRNLTAGHYTADVCQVSTTDDCSVSQCRVQLHRDCIGAVQITSCQLSNTSACCFQVAAWQRYEHVTQRERRVS